MKQSYDKIPPASKIGFTPDPFIKKIKLRQTMEQFMKYTKIGEDPNAERLKKAKPLDIKIGHPSNEYVITKKPRDDGFLANRKEITGPNYTKSNFFN
jgi:hypothetical protein